MTIKELKEKVSLVEYLQRNYKLDKLNSTQYRINPCPICKSKEHFTVYSDTESYSSFSGCCKGGDIIEFFQEVEHLTPQQSINKLKELAGETNSRELKEVNKEVNKIVKEAVKEVVKTSKEIEEITVFIESERVKTATDKEKYKLLKDYLEFRRIDTSLADKYNMFIYNDRIYIPIQEKIKDKLVYTSYLGRAVKDSLNPRYKNCKGTIPLFNSHYLTESGLKTVYITEGIFDTLCLEDIGYKSISLNGVNHINKLKDIVLKNIDKLKDTCFIIATDSDNAGVKCRKELESFFIENKLKNNYIDLEKESVKDINELKVCYDSKEEFKEVLTSLLSDKYKSKTSESYLINNYLEKIKEEATREKIETDFIKFDTLTNGIRSGLYTLGAISSLGKTTFCLNLATDLAKNGNKVIFFSLEQSKFELTNKIISRLTYLNSKGNARTVDMITKNPNIQNDLKFMRAYSDYLKFAKNIIIEESNFNITVDSIRDYIKDFIAVTKEKPIVFIDYLQIIQPKNDKLSDKQNVDYTVTSLKRLSREYDIPVFVISSLNRASYKNKVTFESFKESGGIEYSSDVVLGMQLAILNELESDKNNNDTLLEEKKKANRSIELVCLKNRFGSIGWSIPYEFNSPFHNFSEK